MSTFDWRALVQNGQIPPEILRQLLLEQRRTGKLPVAGLRGAAASVGNIGRARQVNPSGRGFRGGKSGIGTLGSPFMSPNFPDNPSSLPSSSPQMPSGQPAPAPTPGGPTLRPGAPAPSNPGMLADIQRQMSGMGMDPTTAIYSPAPPNIQGPGSQQGMIKGPGNVPSIGTVTPTGVRNQAPSPMSAPASAPPAPPPLPTKPANFYDGNSMSNIRQELASIPTASNPTPPPPAPPVMSPLVNPVAQPDNRQEVFRQLARQVLQQRYQMM